MSEANAAKVYILDVPYHIDRTFDYSIPLAIRDKVGAGSIVYLPFGAGNRQNIGIVREIYSRDDITGLKPIKSLHEGVCDKIGSEDIALAEWIAENTFCTFGEAVRCLLPTGAFSFADYVYSCKKGADASKLNRKAQTVYEFIKVKGAASYPELKREFGEDVGRILSSLCEGALLDRRFAVEDGAKSQYTDYYSLSSAWDAYGENKPKLRGEKQKKIIEYLEDNPSCEESELKSNTGASRESIAGLIEKGFIERQRVERYRTPYSNKIMSSSAVDVSLTDEQEKARETICALCDLGKPEAVLLRGVTGSGKTRVIKAAVDHVLKNGKSVIVLVPEIALTPQMVSILGSYYGESIAVLHSGLSSGERFDEWRRMKEGKAKICVGTRSAIFAPFDNIGLIVIDEEQESSYKSDKSPRYHARDVARFRCAYHNAVMLLSSATPSIESAYKAQSGKYHLIEMEKRYGGSGLPDAYIADLRGEVMTGPIGAVLASEIAANLSSGEQSVLFINRRGYNNFVTCRKCGNTIKCPHCSVSLTYHTRGRMRSEDPSASERGKWGYLSCHWCGYRMKVPQVCPECSDESLEFMGFGTQMVEEELSIDYPDARLLRMDADTTGAKFSFDKMVSSFRAGEKDIMLGTQMVTKGHDFPGVTLVGIVLADSALYMDDFRAGERTFELIAQVIGRAGRAEGKKGRAVIQTYNPENRIIEYGASQNYREFYKNEIAYRRSLVFPPFCDICLITFQSSDEAECMLASDQYARELKAALSGEYKDVGMTVFGPFEAPIYKVGDRYRRRMVIKCKNNRRTRGLLRSILVSFGGKIAKKVNISIDMNPSSI